MQFVDLKAQYARYKSEIDLRMARVLEHGQFILGPEISELETALAQYVGVPYCLSVASGTDSLEIALRALDVGPGDEVVTVPFTWISSSEVIRLVGARPVFVDIEPETFNLDACQLAAAFTPRTKAVIAVNLFGQMADYERINEICQEHNVPVIEDAAQSFGAQQRGRRSGGVTRVGSTSFFPAKPFGCYGDGGALFTHDEALAEKMRAIRTHGGVNRHHHPYVGMNGRFDTLQAAVLLAKFPHFTDELAARSRIAAHYNAALQDFCVIPPTAPGNTHVYAQYTIRVPERDRIAECLKQSNVPTAIYYPKCLHEQPVFANLGYRWGDFPVSETASREVLSLPFHPFLTADDQATVVASFKQALRQVSEACAAQ